jgi:hypothetical protein
MTREIIRPAWAWVCNGCRRADATLAATQQALPSEREMRERGWVISSWSEPVRDLCPECVAKEATDG